MKLTSILLFGTLASSQAAVYTMNLGAAPGQSPIDGVDGWVQSEPNYVDGSGEVYQRSFVHQIGSSSALALGGYYDSEPSTPPGSGVSVSRQLTSLGLNYSTLSLDFTIQDSITSYPDLVPGDVDRNRFSIGFFDNSGDDEAIQLSVFRGGAHLFLELLNVGISIIAKQREAPFFQ